MLGDDGQWRGIMTASYWRKKELYGAMRSGTCSGTSTWI
jgi:hypothetical protein